MCITMNQKRMNKICHIATGLFESLVYVWISLQLMTCSQVYGDWPAGNVSYTISKLAICKGSTLNWIPCTCGVRNSWHDCDGWWFISGLLSSGFKRRASHICFPDFSHLYCALTWKVGISKLLLFIIFGCDSLLSMTSWTKKCHRLNAL